MNESGELLQEICRWIAGKHEGVDPASLNFDLDLIDHRLIDSLDFAEFLFVLEEVSGRTIDLAAVDLDTFRTLRAIQAHFLDLDAHA